MRQVFKSLNEIANKTPYERAGIYIPADVRDQVPLVDGGEPLVHMAEIQAAGIKCGPFWEDEASPSDAPVDEGEVLRQYIKTHKSFSLAVRKSVLEKLVLAQTKMPSNWQLVLKSGHRPLAVQQMLFDAMYEEAKRKYPSYTPEQLFDYTRQYVANPKLAAPAHTTGGAVDVLVEDTSTGKPVDMGSAINIDGEISMTFCKNIPEAAQQNRITLLKAMLAAGFANLMDEWWHFSYGDPYWAAFYSQSKTLYSKVEER